MSSSKAVLVTGASGYIALHCVDQLLAKGYTVIGTVRSQEKAIAVLKKFATKYGSDVKLSFFIVPELAAVGAFDELFQKHPEIEYVLHTASPLTPSDHSTDLKALLVDPAVNGTIGLLSAIHKYAPQVKKVVITSSFAALVNMDKAGDSTFVYTEKTWDPLQWEDVHNDPFLAYLASKKLAETAAWDFIKDNKVNFDLNTIVAPYVFGPQMFDEDAGKGVLNHSANIIKSLFYADQTDASAIETGVYPAVDVRDVAWAHVRAIELDAVKNERLLPLAEGAHSHTLIIEQLNDQFPEYRGKILSVSPEDIKRDQTLAPVIDNSRTLEILGEHEYIPFRQSIGDTARQFLAQEKI